MLEKRINLKVCRMTLRKPCAQEVPTNGREVKPKLVEPELPTVQEYTRRSASEATTPRVACRIGRQTTTLSLVSDL